MYGNLIMTVTIPEFKQAMAQWASGVTVVTTCAENGALKGMTASSFTSLSIDPLLILICVAKKLYSHQVLLQNQIFAVNILSEHQKYWGELFAGMHPEIEDRFSVTGYKTAITGSPILPDVLAWLDCRLYQTHDAGDHTIFIGEVVAAQGNGGALPLTYFNRQWGTFKRIEE